MAIRVLPPETAAKIAAGEVIGRPADAVRELVDNALDAGSSQIRIEIRDGGLDLIRVTDNGCGLPADQVALAFERHATSKIAEADDLFRIDTLGFRGEALPSIAAVAEVTLVTKALEGSVGSFVTTGAGQEITQGRRACQQGTTISVRNLFRNVPARLKFLRSASAEASQIAQLVDQYALGHPHVRFSLLNDGRSAFQSDGTGKLQDAIVKVYGAEVAGGMSPVELDERPMLHLTGYVSEPRITRATRGYITFFVNHRCIQARSFTFAVEEAYHGLLPVGRHPLAVLSLDVPPEEIDVNVHPAKAEVRFLRDRDLYGKLQRAVRRAVTAKLSVAALVGNQAAPLAGVQGHLQPVGLPQTISSPSSASPPRRAEPIVFEEATAHPEIPVEPVAAAPLLRVLGQVGGTFIIAEGPSGVFLIDQHRAHERVLYERFAKERAAAAITSQLLLTPMTLELSARQMALLAPRLSALGDLGFAVEPFGERALLLRAIPGTLRHANLSESVNALLDQAAEDRTEDWQERTVALMACKGAIKSGQILTLPEMRDLVEQLEATALPPMCPHGGPVMVHLSQAQLERHFGRN